MTAGKTKKRKVRALQDALQDRGWSYCACMNLFNKHNGDVDAALEDALRQEKRP